MKIFIKPIQFSFKDEFSIEIEGNKTINDLITEIHLKYNEVNNASFLFRGKKLLGEKTLNEQGIKDATKLMMNKLEGEPTHKVEKTDVSPVDLLKTKAKTKLIETGFQKEMVESVVNTMPNIENLSLDVILEKATVFLTNLKKESLTQFSIEIEEDKIINYDENNICSVFAIGNGMQGQLGVGSYLKTDSPMKVSGLRGLKIKKIACGVYHTTALDTSGRVFCWGRYYMPIVTDVNSTVKETKTGDNNYPVLMDTLTQEMIIEIGCGSNHSLAINDKGELFTWGEGNYGQLGHNALNNEYYPRKLESSKIKGLRFKAVYGGSTHSIAVSINDYLFGWGSNEKNQLNMKFQNIHMEPMILPLFDTIGNYTVDELKNFGFIKGQSDNQFYLKNDVNLVNVISDSLLSEVNDLSFNANDLMKVKFVVCGTWFTVCVSQIFSNHLFIFGNTINKVLKITFFEEKKYEILNISASNNIIIVSTDNGIYKINVNNFSTMKNGEEADKIKSFEQIQFEKIEKIGCGADYFLALTNRQQVIFCQNFEAVSYLNIDLKHDIQSFSNGPSHYFLISNFNNFSFGERLYLNLKRSIQKNEYKDFDMFIKGSKAITGENIVWPVHSFMVDQFINIDSFPNDQGKISIPLNDEKIEMLIELIYTSQIKNLNSIDDDNNKTILENIENLNTLIYDLVELKEFLSLHEGKNSYLLINLIKLFVEKFRELINFNTFSKDFESAALNKFLTETTSYIINKGAKEQMKDTLTNLRKENSRTFSSENLDVHANEDMEEDDDDYNRRQEKFKGKGVKLSLSYEDDYEEDMDLSRLLKNKFSNYFSFLNNVNDKTSVNLNHEIIKLQKTLNELRNLNLKEKQSSKNTFTLKCGSKTYEINRHLLKSSSLFFEYLINSELEESRLNRFDVNDNFGNFIEKIVNFLRKENFDQQASDIFELLDISQFFMIDSLTSLIESELERIINLNNVLCLLEVSRNNTLFFLRRSCINFLMMNFTEAKNKSIFKYIDEEDKKELKKTMALNNRSML